MNFKIVTLEIFAILISALIFSMPLVAATDINIFFNGVKKTEVEYKTENLINKQIEFIHEAKDILWKNVKVAVKVNSASLAKEIKKIYLYKCKKLSPANCIQSEPQVFENFIDVELLWTDISEREGVYAYPQVANLLIVIKLEDLSGTVSWIGLWSQIRRSAYNTFTEYDHELSEIDLHASSLDIVNPIKMYIENYGMIPFNWLTKAVFKTANTLYALGADESEIESSAPRFLTATPPTNEIDTINKDFYLIFSNTSSGIANPLTLNLNPTFSCGDGACEADLGETPGSCCYDCPCGGGQYCDVDPTDPTTGECKDLSQVSLQVVSTSSPQITDCSGTFDVNITLKINNPPSSLHSDIPSVFKLDETVYSTSCYGGPPEYWCVLTLNSDYVECGQGSYNIGPNDVTTSIIYTDGPNDMSLTLNTSFSPIIVNYDCSCDDGFYCDIGTDTCKSEDAITLGITSLTSYLDNYNEGDTIDLTAKIFNPPTGLTVISTSATLNLTGGQVSPGSPTCTGPSADYEYSCSIPFQIVGYSRSNSYTFDPNTLIFTITYKDGTIDKTKVLETNFGPVSIPSQYCGDGVCNMGETQESCCIDCDCSEAEDYCDPVRGCESTTGVTVSVDSATPTEFTDCRQPHLVNITLRVVNPPSTLTLDHYFHITGNLPSGWGLQCDDSGYGGVYYCHLTIPSIEGCSLPYYEIGNNELNVSISFDDGAPTSTLYSRITKQMSAQFSNIKVIPIYECGDGVCESNLGEGPGNCCIDCPCSSGQYCDVTPSNTDGVCRSKDAISLVIDSPKQTVRFTSCELPHNINIKAHVKNQPSNMKPEYYYGTLNGSSAELMHCDVEDSYGAANFSFNCTMTVSPEFKCEKDKTYTYRDNSFSIFISYMNGDITETKSLSGKLPNVVVTQTIRSMYEIMQEAEKKMNESLQKVKETAEDMFEEYKKCVDRVKKLAQIMYLVTVASLMFGTIKFTGLGDKIGGIFKGKWDGRQFGDFISLVSMAGSSLMQMLTNLCNLIASTYQIDLTVQRIQMDMIKMQMCMEINQHMLDIGQCRGREESCFNALINCVSFGNVNSWMNALNSIMQQVRQTAQNMGSASNRFWFGYGGSRGGFGTLFGAGGQSSFHVVCNQGGGDTSTTGPCCSKYLHGTTCMDSKIKVMRQGGYCNYPVVEMVKPDNSRTRIYVNQYYVIEPTIISSGAVSGDEVEVKYEFYCFDSSENYVPFNPTKNEYSKEGEIQHRYAKANPDCKCPGISGTTTTQTTETEENHLADIVGEIGASTEGKYVKLTAKIKDVDGDTVHYTWWYVIDDAFFVGQMSGCEDGCDIVGEYTYPESGTYTVKLEVSDDSSYPPERTVSRTKTVTVS